MHGKAIDNFPNMGKKKRKNQYHGINYIQTNKSYHVKGNKIYHIQWDIVITKSLRTYLENI